MSIEQSICDAVDIIVNRAISQAGFDKTISAVVVECIDQVIGKYKVKYQDSVYYATSDNASTVYNTNSEVYVLIPNGDFSKDKKILGTVKSLGANYITSVEGDEGYEYIGTNVISSYNEIGLCSYKSEAGKQMDYKMLYDADSATEQPLQIDIAAVEEYLKQSTHLIAGAKFKTKLDKVQRNYGDYGLIFSLEFLDDAKKEPIIKDYVVNVDNMIGQPYNLTTFIRQTEEFEINGENFQRVKSIVAFAKGFPNTDSTKPDDIFIKDIELNGAVQINSAALDSYYLALMTSKGTFFPKDTTLEHLDLKAEIKIKGKVIDNSLHNTSFYWFVEHAGVDSSHVDYCKHGGQGWKCLNEYNIIAAVMDDEGNVVSSQQVEWVPGNDNFSIYKKDILAYQTKFKCVCVYDESITLEKAIVIKNYNADYKIELQSSNGVDFTYDQGSTTLTCVVDNKQNLEYNYYWSKKNNVGTYEALTETEEENSRYQQALDLKEYLEEGFKEETFFKTQMASIPDNYPLIKEYIEKFLGIEYTYDECYNSVVSYLSNKTITRVEKNVIHNLLVKTITNFSVYSCSVFQVNDDGSETQVGNASIKITNSFDKQQGYSLIIHNGTQVFKYNEAGLSPSHSSNENPIEIPTLSFTLFDENGNAIEEDVIRRNCDVKWIVPNKETMISSNIQGGEKGEENTVYSDTLIFDYDIYPTYGVNKNRNNIDLEVTYKSKVMKARTNFTFLKDGDSGTNGTDYVCKIVPNIKSGDIIPQFPTLTLQNSDMIMNYNIADGNRWGTDAATYTNWFKVQLWNLDELVYEGIEGDTDYKVTWSILKNNYGKKNGTTITETSYINVTSNGVFSKGANYSTSTHPADIVKVTILYEEKQYSATIPLIVATVPSSSYRIQLKEGTGFNSVLYSSDGTKPKYDATNPFELEVLYKPSGSNWIDVSTSAKYNPQYTWNVKGTVYDRGLKNPTWVETKIVRDYSSNTIGINQKKLMPNSGYNGQCINVGLEATVAINSQTLNIHIPIHCLLNQYGLSALNDWDGNSIELNEDEGMLLSPQVGAGKKNADNTFTGIVMGTVDDPADSDGNHKTGLLGYASGQRSIFLDAETGKAEFGIEGKSKIVLDPTQDKAQIYSGNYSEDLKTGLLIDLTTPEIKYGSGRFHVNAEGKLTAQDGGSIAGWEIGVDKLYKGNVGISSKNRNSDGDIDNTQYAFWAGATSGANSDFSVQFDGSIKAKKGTVGGWNIDAGNIYTGTLTTATTASPGTNSVRLSNSVYKAKVAGTEGSSWRFNVGNNFGVTSSGSLYCSAGYIGGWEITSSGLKATSTDNTGTYTTVLNRDGTINVNNGEFKVEKNGNTTINGTLKTSGNVSIGGKLTVAKAGSLTINGTLTVTGSTKISGSLTVGSSITMGNATMEVREQSFLCYYYRPTSGSASGGPGFQSHMQYLCGLMLVEDGEDEKGRKYKLDKTYGHFSFASFETKKGHFVCANVRDNSAS